MSEIIREIKEEVGRFKVARQNKEMTRAQKIAFEQRIFEKLRVECGKCSRCTRTDNLTLDHIVPQVILADFGVDISREIIPENYQLLCRPCNVFKSGRLDFSLQKTKEILLKLLDRI